MTPALFEKIGKNFIIISCQNSLIFPHFSKLLRYFFEVNVHNIVGLGCGRSYSCALVFVIFSYLLLCEITDRWWDILSLILTVIIRILIWLSRIILICSKWPNTWSQRIYLTIILGYSILSGFDKISSKLSSFNMLNKQALV